MCGSQQQPFTQTCDLTAQVTFMQPYAALFQAPTPCLCVIFSLRILVFNMRVRRRLSEKSDHDTAFGNLHRWTLIVAAPIKRKKRKKIEVRGSKIVEMNTDPILRQILSSFLCSSTGTTFGISLCCASNTFLIPEPKHLNHF